MHYFASYWQDWVEIGIVLVFAFLLLRAKKAFRRVGAGSGFEKFFTLTVWFLALMAVLQILGINIVPLLTLSGIGAAVLGFASKDVIANFFSGLMIYVTKPFTAGELIEIPGKNITGHVEEIGWYLTSIREMNKRPIYLPNSIFSTELLTNHSRMTHRWINEKIRIRSVHPDRADAIIKEIRSLFERQTQIDSQQPISVFLLSLSPFSLEIEVKAYTRLTSYHEFMELKQKILLQVYQIAYANEKGEWPKPRLSESH